MTFDDYEEMFYKNAKPLKVYRSRIPLPYRTDEEIARRLHAEFNCAPMRTSRSRRTMDLEDRRDGGTPEDPVHDNDPGILPSC